VPIAIYVTITTTGSGGAGVARLVRTGDAIAGGQEGRLSIWTEYFVYTYQHPWTGSGFGNAATTYNYEVLRLTGFAKAPHSFVIQYMIAPGLVAGAIFAWFGFYVVKGMWAPNSSLIKESMLLVALSVSPSLMFDTMASTQDWGPYIFWVLLLLAARMGASPPQTARQ
jgi:O-antigen ligase